MAETISVLMAASFFCGFLAFGPRSDLAIQSRLAELSPIGRTGRWSSRTLTRLGRSTLAERIPGRDFLRRRLELAGAPTILENVLGLKLALAGAAPGLALALAPASAALILLSPVVGLAAFKAPDLALARIAKRRRASIDARLPELLELLVATTEAGLSLPVAFRRTAEVIPGPLGEELRVGVAQLDLGVPWRRVLEDLADRTSLPWLRRLVSALGRSHRLGAPVGNSLKSLADDLRSERRARAEELARRAPVKMLFPLVFLILPAFLLLTVGPVLLATIRSLH
jgi:tight adherence protein C